MPNRPPHAVEVELKVAFHHCDPLGIAWHGRYFEWLEIARTELFASRELEVHQIRDLDCKLFVVEANCRYMLPLQYGEPLRIVAWFIAVEPLIRVGYDIYNVTNGRWSARAITQLATTDFAGTLLPKTPDALLARLPTL